MEFYSLITDIGINKLIEAKANNQDVFLEYFAIGDGGNSYYEPEKTQTALVNERYRTSISRAYQDKNILNRLVIECALPADVGGYFIREAGVFDNTGNLFAIAKVPESYKPIQQEGATKDVFIRIFVELENSDDVNLIIDPNVQIISKEQLDLHDKDESAHSGLINAHSVDGYHAGNNENEVAISNGQKCEKLNADMLNGYHAGNKANEVCLLNSNGLVPKENLPSTVPAGAVMSFAMINPPDGWLIADGREVSRNNYAELFKAIGLIFGSGDGSNTFNLPDLRGEFIRGFDKDKGVDKDREFGSFQPDELKAHTHITYYGRQNTENDWPHHWSLTDQWAGGQTSNSQPSGGIETRPRNIALLYCIKY